MGWDGVCVWGGGGGWGGRVTKNNVYNILLVS